MNNPNTAKNEHQPIALIANENNHDRQGKWSLNVLHDYVATVLEEPKEEIDLTDNLLEWGLNSLALMKLVTVLKQDHFDISLEELLATPNLAHWYQLLQQKQSANITYTNEEIAPVEDLYAPFPLTDVQLAYWLGRNRFFELGGVGAHGYIEVKAKDICPKRLEKALNQVIAENPMLRAIVNNNGEQLILPQVPEYKLLIEDAQGDNAAKIDVIREAMEHEVISADNWPLFNICLSQHDKTSYLIHISFDILIFDLKSLELWVSKWWAFYDNPAIRTLPSRYSFVDYVAQQSQLSANAEHSRQYWQARIPSLPLGPIIPLAKSTENLIPKFTRVQTVIPQDIWARLQNKIQKSGAMPSSLLLAAYAKILATWGESQHFCLTMTLFNRDMTGLPLEQVIGDFTHLFVLEADVREQQGFIQFVKKLQQQLLQDLNHKVVSGIEVLGKMAEHHKTPNKAMLPFVFTSTLGSGRSYLDAFSCFGEITRAAVQTPQVLIDHQTLEHNGNLVLNWDYVEEAFPKGMVDAMASSHHRLLMMLAEQAEAWEDPHLCLLPPEQQSARRKFHDTEAEFTNPATRLHESFLHEAQRQPERTAVVNGDREISYGELDQASNIIAQALLTEGVKPGELVAVVMEKGWQQIIAIMAILKSGAAYIPIDASHPLKRVQTLLKVSEANIALLANKKMGQHITQQQFFIDNALLEQTFTGSCELMNQAQASDLAYVIFTSGSTGKPKGAMLSHGAALNTLLDINQRYQISSESTCLMVSSLSFDLSVYDVFGILAAGGKVVIPNVSPLPDPVDWLALVENHGVNLWNSVPALFHIFYDYLKDVKATPVLKQLNHILQSGDWLNVNTCAEIREFLPDTCLISVGGPTETAIWSGTYEMKTVDRQWPSIPFGHAMANQQLYLFNQQLQQVPDWVRGEMYIGGKGLGQGYWGDKAKTDAAFIIHPQTGQRLYRSGDEARMLPNGLLEMLGRKDNQVKINGIRIELGEIEACLSSLESVEQATVVARRNQELGDQLYAFITCDTNADADYSNMDIGNIEKQLAELLPQQLLPKMIKPLRQMPLTPNGKIDRGALVTQAQAVTKITTQTPTLAASEIEQALLVIWSDLLSQNVYDISANFFALGGTSLLASKLALKINAKFDSSIAVIKVFEHSDIRAQAELIESELIPLKEITNQKPAVRGRRNKSQRNRRKATRVKI